MTRMMLAVPAVPMITIGSGRCFRRSITLASVHGAPANSGENRPPALIPRLTRMNIRITTGAGGAT